MAHPKPGGAYVYRGTDPIGTDSLALTPGTHVKVREVVSAGEAGAHDDSEDSVVIEWESPALVQGENGMELGTSPRAMSIGVAHFSRDFKGA
jgi:hypothetical protein